MATKSTGKSGGKGATPMHKMPNGHMMKNSAMPKGMPPKSMGPGKSTSRGYGRKK